MRIRFTRHARTVLRERGIDPEWVVRVVRQPEELHADSNRPEVTLAFGQINEFGRRTLRVAYLVQGQELRVLTAFFDRAAGRRRSRTSGP